MTLPGHPPRRLVGLALGFGLLYGLWVLLVEDYDLPELLAGIAAALIALICADLAIDHELGLHAAGRGTTPWPPLLRMVRDSFLVLGAALLAGLRLRPLRSGFRSMPADSRGNEPGDAARRALLIARQSFAPNTCVVGFDDTERTMVVHQLVPTLPRRRAGRRR
jgi:multisubunit Na+/H+ antiporter MnhE subunit